MVPCFITLTAAILAAAPFAHADLLEWARNPFSGRWVGFATNAKTWAASEAHALSLQGHLLTVRSATENTWTFQTFRGLSTNEAWIGLSDVAVEGTFGWTSGEAVAFTHFAAGEPDDAGSGEDSVSFDLAVGNWHDRPTLSLRNYLVERTAAPTSGWTAPVGHVMPYSAGQIWPCDIDGDGRTDLLVVGNGSGARLCSLLQQANGTFVFSGCALAGSSTVLSAIGDFDGDGHIDVVSGGGLSNALVLNRGSPGGVFGPTMPVFSTGIVTSIAAADIDSDGRDELVVAWWLLGNQIYLSVLGGGSSAGFTQQVDMAVVQRPYDLDAGDMNGDGFVDFHATSSSVAPHDQTFFGQGTLNLIPGPTFAGAPFFGEAALADLDGDADLDVAYRTSGFTPNLLSVAWNDGAGNLTGGSVIATTDTNGAMAAADLDGDGIGDVIASEYGPRRVAIVRSLGGGAFASPEYLALGGSPSFVTAADVRGDSSPELVIAVYNVTTVHVTLLDNLAPDCNGNGVDDPRDIELGVGSDANADGALDACQPAGAAFCAGDGSATSCPCTPSAPPGAGCANSTGTGGRLTAIGSASIAADALRINASGLPPTSTTRLVQGTVGVNGGSGTPFGDGLHCAGGALVRIVQRAASGGVAAYGAGVAGDPPISTSGGVTPGRRVYQVVYRDAMPYCTSAAFNTTNGLSVVWGP